MEGPRLSIASSSGSSLECCDDSPLPSPCLSLPETCPNFQVGSVVVNGDNNNIHHGNLTTVTYNQFIVPGTGDVLDSVPVKISSEIHSRFFPTEVPGIHKIPGDKEDLAGLQKRWCCLIGALVSLSFITLLTTSLFSLSSMHNQNNNNNNSPLTATTVPPIENITFAPADMAGAPRMMNRKSWVGQPPVGDMDSNTLPVRRVIVCHTATDPCTSTADCISIVRYIQQFHVESRKWGDIAYNFLIGGDGVVYIGRGWDEMGAHTKGENNGTVGVAFIGTYVRVMPNEWQIDAFHKLMDLGVKIGKLAQNYTLQAQCQLQSTAAPGLALANNMTSWPHFDKSLTIRCTDGGT